MQKLSDSSEGTQKQIGFQTIKQPDSARREKQKVADNREGYQQKGIALGVDPDDRIMSQYLLGVSKANVLLA